MAGSSAEESAAERPPQGSVGAPARPALAPWLDALRFCLARSRFSVLFLVVGLALLLGDQGRDLLIAYGEDHKTVRLAAGAFLWALSLWGWSRVLLDIRYPDHPRNASAYHFWRRVVPRALGGVAFLVIAFAAWRARRYALSLAALVALAAFLAWVTTRRRTTRAVAGRLRASRASLLAWAGEWLDVEDFGPPRHEGLRAALGLARGGPGGRVRPVTVIAVASALGFVASCLAAFAAPVWLGSSGAMIVFFLWAVTSLPLASALSYGADRVGVPLLTALVLVALVSSFSNDNHEIRRLGGGTVPARRSVKEALAAWGTRTGPPGKDGETPFVVVATAGGGIRAAYWTATVLGELHDNAPAFRGRLFAVSGVSGGSVGATVYRALWPLDPRKLPPGACGPGLAECGQAVLGEEFLGPLAAALLYPDLAQRFSPLAAFPDRAKALEESWEAAFRAQTGVDGLRGSLAALSAAGGPHLLLNATWADNGRRIVASDLRLEGEETFARSNDQVAELGHDLRLSTAAHNSARFPFVSPPGMWRRADGKIAGRLQDGGLVENYGAETAIELLEAACREFACPRPGPWRARADAKAEGRRRIRPVVVIITSDPTLPEGFARSPHVEPLGFGYETRTTFQTYERVRGGRGAEAAARLVEWTEGRGGETYELRMCSGVAKGASPPLGWALSEAAKERIRGFLQPTGEVKDFDCRSRNVQALGDLMALLGGEAAEGR